MRLEIERFYRELDGLYGDLCDICMNCKFDDCKGYVWLLKEEADRLVDAGIDVVEINEGLNFIHSFDEENGQVVIDRPKPPCRHCIESLCKIRELRPLVCRMYPVGFISDPELGVVIGLHMDCQFSFSLEGQAKSDFFRKVEEIFWRLPQGFLSEIISLYREVDAISDLPFGPNLYEVVVPISTILNGR